MNALRKLEPDFFILAILIGITILPLSFFAGDEELFLHLPLFITVLIACIFLILTSGSIYLIRYILGDVNKEVQEIRQKVKNR